VLVEYPYPVKALPEMPEMPETPETLDRVQVTQVMVVAVVAVEQEQYGVLVLVETRLSGMPQKTAAMVVKVEALVPLPVLTPVLEPLLPLAQPVITAAQVVLVLLGLPVDAPEIPAPVVIPVQRAQLQQDFRKHCPVVLPVTVVRQATEVQEVMAALVVMAETAALREKPAMMALITVLLVTVAQALQVEVLDSLFGPVLIAAVAVVVAVHVTPVVAREILSLVVLRQGATVALVLLDQAPAVTAD